jgi:hypothetical protein
MGPEANISQRSQCAADTSNRSASTRPLLSTLFVQWRAYVATQLPHSHKVSLSGFLNPSETSSGYLFVPPLQTGRTRATSPFLPSHSPNRKPTAFAFAYRKAKTEPNQCVRASCDGKGMQVAASLSCTRRAWFRSYVVCWIAAQPN